MTPVSTQVKFDVKGESLEPQSLLPGNGIFGPETKRSKTTSKGQGHRDRDNVSLNNPASSELVAENREISVSGKMRGGTTSPPMFATDSRKASRDIAGRDERPARLPSPNGASP
jgi:hypothetical protein